MRKEVALIAAGLGIVLSVKVQAPPMLLNRPLLGTPDQPVAGGGGPCQPLDCSAVTVATPPGFDYPNPADFTPDRRPSLKVGCWGGSCTFPPAGLPDWWVDLGDVNGNGITDGVDELLAMFDEAYADGWRRIIMASPGGSYSGLVASSNWWPLPVAMRDSLTMALPDWLAAHPDATVGAYMGFAINDPCELCMHTCLFCNEECALPNSCDLCPECAGAPQAHIPLSTNALDMCLVYQNIEPWIDAGLYEIWFDHAGGNDVVQWDQLLQLAGNPDYAGRIKFVGEPIVTDGQGGGFSEPILDAAQRMGFVSRRRYYEDFGGNAPPEVWVFDPATTEVHVIFRSDSFCRDEYPNDGDPCTGCPEFCGGVPEQPNIDVVYDFIQRGYVPHARGATNEEYVRRILDMNVETLPCPEDLDADGDVDADDADRVATNIGMATGATLYHGDVDFDDDVDVIDYFLLVSHPGFPGPCD